MDKSAVKRSYKQTKQPMGVYWIRNSQNDKVYIGFAIDLRARLERHKAELKFGSHRNKGLQEMWNSFGASSFEFEILDELDHEEKNQERPDEDLRILAEMWIQKMEKAGHSVLRL